MAGYHWLERQSDRALELIGWTRMRWWLALSPDIPISTM